MARLIINVRNPRKTASFGAASSQSRSRLRGEKKGRGERERKKEEKKETLEIASSVWDITKDIT